MNSIIIARIVFGIIDAVLIVFNVGYFFECVKQRSRHSKNREYFAFESDYDPHGKADGYALLAILFLFLIASLSFSYYLLF